MAHVICNRALEHVGCRPVSVAQQELAIRLFTLNLYRWGSPGLGLLLLICAVIRRARGDEAMFRPHLEALIAHPEAPEFEPPGGNFPTLLLEGVAAERARRPREQADPAHQRRAGTSTKAESKRNARASASRARGQRAERRTAREEPPGPRADRPSVRRKRYWWKVLGVSPAATEEQIQRAYRQLAKEVAPRRHEDSEEELKELNVARDEAIVALRSPVRWAR